MAKFLNTSGNSGINLDTVTDWKLDETAPLGMSLTEAQAEGKAVPRLTFHHLNSESTSPTTLEGESANDVHEQLLRMGMWEFSHDEKIKIVRGAIIGAFAGGHLEGRDSVNYSKGVLLQIADILGIDIPKHFQSREWRNQFAISIDPSDDLAVNDHLENPQLDRNDLVIRNSRIW